MCDIRFSFFSSDDVSADDEDEESQDADEFKTLMKRQQREREKESGALQDTTKVRYDGSSLEENSYSSTFWNFVFNEIKKT